MKFSSVHIFSFLLSLLMLHACAEKMETSTEYKIINTVLDSVVKASRKKRIGFNLKPLNHILSEEMVMNQGFLFYEDGKFYNECLENNINSSQFSNFDYSVFSTNQTVFDSLKITNTSITTSFQISKKYQERLKELVIESDTSSQKKDIQSYLWENEQSQRIYSISTPIFSITNEIAVVFVAARDYGIQSWTLQRSDSYKWTIFCVEQITVE